MKKKAKRKVKATPKLTKAEKKGTALNKARSALKKAEHATTPLSIKRKLKSKKEQ